jgi:hypothetical protein
MLFNEQPRIPNEKPRVIYAPTNRFPLTNGSSKGYPIVTVIINELVRANLNFSYDLIEGVSHEEDLSRKRKGDIIIDDVVNDTWHNTSLQAACFGAISLTGNSTLQYPFVRATLNTLKEVLTYYIVNKQALKSAQEKIVAWRKVNYTPEILLNKIETLYNL